MSKESTLLLFGILVFISPLLGIPEMWRSILLFALGALIVLIGIFYWLDARRSRRSAEETIHKEHDPYAHGGPLVTPR